MEGIMAFCGLVFMAMLTKLSTSEDPAWLLPFVTGQSKRRRIAVSILYVLTLQGVVVLSALVAWSALQVLDARTLQLMASGVLLVYAAYLLIRRSLFQQRPKGSVIVASFVGSPQELCSFPSLLAGGIFSFWQLSAGVGLACLLVVGVCLGISKFQFVVKYVNRVPYWAIISVYAMIILAQTFS